MKPFLLGVLSTIVLGAFLGLLVVSSGVVNVSALWDVAAMDGFLGYASRRSIAHHAQDISNPFHSDSAALAVGLDHYKDNCLVCHGAPGVASSELAKGLNPPAPNLTTDAIQKKSDGELLWVVSNGIRMTGMPAFSPTHEEDEIWKVVAFVRHLGSLTDAEKATLSAGHGDEMAHHDHAHAESGESAHTERQLEEGHAHDAGSKTAHEPTRDSGAGHEDVLEAAIAGQAGETALHDHHQAQGNEPAHAEHSEEKGLAHDAGTEVAHEPGQPSGSDHGHHSDSAAETAHNIRSGATDDEIVGEQKASYPLTTCVITGEELGKRGAPIDYVVEGRLVRLCCDDCKKEVDMSLPPRTGPA